MRSFRTDETTACGHRMANRKWKETKLQPGTAGPGNMLGCCLVTFHFLWAILCPQAVQFDYIIPSIYLIILMYACHTRARVGFFLSCGFFLSFSLCDINTKNALHMILEYRRFCQRVSMYSKCTYE